jgi:hypothetical protein
MPDVVLMNGKSALARVRVVAQEQLVVSHHVSVAQIA